MKLFKQFKLASLSLCLLILLVVSCEKNSALLLDTNEVDSLVHFHRNIVKEFSLSEDFDKLIPSFQKDLVLFENRFSLLYQNYGEEFITLYNEIYVEKVFSDFEYIFVGKVTIRSTPCYDAYKSSTVTNMKTMSLCMINAAGQIEGMQCSLNYTANMLTNEQNFEDCLVKTYE